MKTKLTLVAVVVLLIGGYIAYVSISSEKVNVLRRKITKEYIGTDTIVSVFDHGKFITRFRVPNGKITTPESTAGYAKNYWFCDSKEYGLVQSNMSYIASDKEIPIP